MSYSAVDYLLMFAANFGVVFLLGLQSRNVTAGNHIAAVITSFGISVANFTFVKYAATGTLSAFLVCAIGGCLGIATSIWAYESFERGRRKNGGRLRRHDDPIEGKPA